MKKILLFITIFFTLQLQANQTLNQIIAQAKPGSKEVAIAKDIV